MSSEKSAKDLEVEALQFAEELFADLMSRHPSLQHLPQVTRKPSAYNVGKAVMYTWHVSRKTLLDKLKFDFPKFAKNDEAFKAFLEELCDIVRQSSQDGISQVLGLSAVLLELLSFLYSRGIADFLQSAPYYWLFMFRLFASDFYKDGGFRVLNQISLKPAEDYDNSIEEIYEQYWWPIPEEFETSNESSKKTTNATDCSSGILADDTPPNPLTTEATKPGGTLCEERKVESDSNPVRTVFSKEDVIQAAPKTFKSKQITKHSPFTIRRDVTSKDKRSKNAHGESKCKTPKQASGKIFSPKHLETPKDKEVTLETKQSTSTVRSSEKKKPSPVVARQMTAKNAKIPPKVDRSVPENIEKSRRFSVPKNMSSNISKSSKSDSSNNVKRSASQERNPLSTLVKSNTLKGKYPLPIIAKGSNLKGKPSLRDPVKASALKESAIPPHVALRGRVKKPAAIPEELISSNPISVPEQSISNDIMSNPIASDFESSEGTSSEKRETTPGFNIEPDNTEIAGKYKATDVKAKKTEDYLPAESKNTGIAGGHKTTNVKDKEIEGSTLPAGSLSSKEVSSATGQKQTSKNSSKKYTKKPRPPQRWK